MKIETLTYSEGETTFQGYLADPEGSGLRPGVLIVHEAPGLNDHPKRRARSWEAMRTFWFEIFGGP